ncbi:MAG: hypothetical protein Q8941_13895 [Bacteroidota bacterium]|nr:hypothetical protein [Bacteroidota bacterium]
MTDKHPADNEIQQYVLEISACEAKIVEHVEACEECKSKVAAYQLLFTGIREQPGPAFDFNLEKMVLAQLAPPKTKRSPENFYLYLFVMLGIALTGTVLYIYRSYVAGLFEGIAPLSIYLIVTTVSIILIALIIDMYKNYQKKMKALNLY